MVISRKGGEALSHTRGPNALLQNLMQSSRALTISCYIYLTTTYLRTVPVLRLNLEVCVINILQGIVVPPTTLCYVSSSTEPTAWYVCSDLPSSKVPIHDVESQKRLARSCEPCQHENLDNTSFVLVGNETANESSVTTSSIFLLFVCSIRRYRATAHNPHHE